MQGTWPLTAPPPELLSLGWEAEARRGSFLGIAWPGEAGLAFESRPPSPGPARTWGCRGRCAAQVGVLTSWASSHLSRFSSASRLLMIWTKFWQAQEGGP